MLAGALRTLLAALVVGSLTVVPDAEARPHHHHHRRSYGYPYVHVAYGPGYYPGVAFGYHGYPFSIGLAFPGAPRDERGTLKTLVEPRVTEVFVDGYFAGVVDDFDGSRRLRLEPGPHTITLFLEGHRLYEETVYSTVGSEIKIRHEMEPLAPGEPPPVRPGTPAAATVTTSPIVDRGALSIRPDPPDAEIWIDGELWYVPSGTSRFTVHLPPGRYRLEVRKAGYESFVDDVEIFSGETSAMNVRLVPTP